MTQHPTTTRLAGIEDALADLRAGRPVLVADDENRENEADIVMAGETMTTETMAWAIRHSSGVICAPMPDVVADRLALPPMVSRNEDPKGTAYTVSVDAKDGVYTGISAADRALTLRLLADPESSPATFTRPGHVFPLRARPGGVLERDGHTEASVDLCRLAGLAPVAMIVELVHDDGRMMRLPDAVELADREGLSVITIEQLIAWRRLHDRVRPVATATLPTEDGVFTVTGFDDRVTGAEHLALVASTRGSSDADRVGARDADARDSDARDVDGLTDDADIPLVRVHSECLTGDALGSLRCDCGPQLRASRQRIAADGGVLVYLRGHEGRGVGLLNKMRAYGLQDAGFDTVDAQTELGLPIEAREYGAAAAILRELGHERIRLLTNNPAKAQGLREHGIDVVEQVPLVVGVGEYNAAYVETKRARMGHLIDQPVANLP